MLGPAQMDYGARDRSNRVLQLDPIQVRRLAARTRLMPFRLAVADNPCEDSVAALFGPTNKILSVSLITGALRYLRDGFLLADGLDHFNQFAIQNRQPTLQSHQYGQCRCPYH